MFLYRFILVHLIKMIDFCYIFPHSTTRKATRNDFVHLLFSEVRSKPDSLFRYFKSTLYSEVARWGIATKSWVRDVSNAVTRCQAISGHFWNNRVFWSRECAKIFAQQCPSYTHCLRIIKTLCITLSFKQNWCVLPLDCIT